MFKVISEISTGYWLNSINKNEAQTREDNNWIPTAFLQYNQMSYALNFSSLALSAAGLSRLTLITDFHCKVLPAVTLLYCKIVDPQAFPLFHNMGRFVHNHLSTVSHLVLLISSVSLAFFGQSIGVFTVAWMAFGFFERAELLDLGILGSAINLVGLGAKVISTLVDGGWIIRAMIISTLVVYILVPRFYKNVGEIHEVPETEATKKSILDIETLELDLKKLKVASGHVNVVENIIEAPSYDNNKLLIDFESFKNKDSTIFEISVANTEKFKFLPHLNSNEAYEFLNKGLKQFVQKINSMEMILVKSAYELKFLNMIKHIFNYIDKLPSSEKIDALNELGKCGHDESASFKKIQEFYYLSTDDHPSLSIASKTYRCLDKARANMYESVKIPFNDERDIAYTLGLPWIKIFPDSEPLGIVKIITRNISSILHDSFWEQYNPTMIYRFAYNFGLDSITHLEKTKWFIAQFIKDFQQKHSKVPTDDEVQTFCQGFPKQRSKYNTFFLIKMGILE